MLKDYLILKRIKELNSLIKTENLIFCLYPFSFALKELIQDNLYDSKFQRVFTSSIDETIEFLNSTKNEYVIFISEYLKDGIGTRLLMDVKNFKNKHKCIIFLNGKDKNNLNVALILKANGIVHEESLEEKNGSLVKALKYIKEGRNYLDPKINKIIGDNDINLNSPLTRRHIELIQLLTEGLSNKEIAEKLSISSNTVRDHLKEIMKRLNTNSRIGIINLSRQIGIIN